MEAIIVVRVAVIEHLAKEVLMKFAQFAFGKMMDKIITMPMKFVAGQMAC